MKKSLLIFSILASFFLSGQDIGVTQITSPVTGCNLSSTESVVVKIFNYGSNMSGVPFSVSYTINGGAPQTDAGVVFPSFLTNSTVTYTISIPANLSTPGTYTLTATATVAGDINSSNDAVTGYTVTNNAPSAGGSIAGGTNVCVTANSGNLTLAGQTGNILNWEYSTDGGATWFTLSNTTNTQSYSNVTVQTDYRVKVQNPGCTAAYSDTATLTIDPASVGGSVSGTATRCISGNSGTMNLTGSTGNVLNWEFSTNGGASWTSIANTTTSQTYLNLVQTTRYRAVLQSGACPSANSGQAIITISPLSVGGNIAGSDTVCAGSNTGVLTLSGQTGSILWQFSTNGGASFSNVSPVNSTTSLTYNNVPATRLYRTRVTSGACPAVFSDTASIVTTAATIPGSVAGSGSACSGSNTDTLVLSGQSGNIVDWESSTDGGTTWVGLGNTTTSHIYNNIASNTLFHVLVQAPGCNPSASGAATITVNNPSVGGTISSNTTVCASSNNGTLNLSGETGSIIRWLSSDDNGSTWDTIVNTSNSQSFTNLSDTTIYIAVVANGVCPSDTSDTVTVFVDQVTVAGTVSSSSTVCFGNNADTLDLTGNNGSVLSWESSIDNGVTWVTLSNTSTSQPFSNITDNTVFRALVKNGTCANAYSGSATISVSPVAVGGTVYGGTTVCSSGNSGTLTLVGHSTGVVQWEASVDNGTTWTPIANTTAFENFSNLSQTTWYQAIVNSGVCPNDTSSVAVVNVDTASVGGVVSISDTVCSGQNGDTLNLSGNNGVVTGWQMSTDGGATWIALANAGASQTYANLSTTTMFRTEVKNGVCPSVTSSAATITVDPVANGGTISGGTTVCSSGNSGTLTLTGYNANVVEWAVSTDSGATWTPVTNTTATESFTNLTQTTWYHAVVSSGVCSNDTSMYTIVAVDTVSVGGTVSADDTVCVGQNGTLNLAGNTGSVTAWQISTDGGSTWTTLSNTGASQSYNNIATTTMFRAEIKNGVCASTTSVPATITVDQLSAAGTISSAATVCEAYNNGLLTLTGNNGAIVDWQSSADGGATWTSLANSTSQQPYSNLSDTTWFRAIAKSGVCASDTGAPVIITVMPKPNAQFTAPDTCFGIATTFTNNTSISTGYVQLYNWSFGDNSNSVSGSPVHMYSDTGTYNVSLVALSNFGCLDTVIIPVKVIGLPSAAFTASGPLQFCSGDTVTLGVPSLPGTTYLWSTGDTLSSITVDTTGTWSVVVTDTVSGCINSDSVSTIVNPAPTVNAGIDDTLSIGNSLTLAGSGSGTFSWSPASSLDIATNQNPVATPTVTTTFTLTVTNNSGCAATDSVRIVVEQGFDFTIYTVITPNGDGFNDTWNIKNISFYPDNEVIIFNRHGQKVFGMTGYDNSWDGTFAGTPVPDGTYYYVLKFSDSDKSFTGAITVLRASK